MGWLSWILGRGSPSREEILSEPFRKEWLELVQRVLPSFGGLVAEQQRYLCESIQLFVAQKQFRGLDGLDITDQIRLAIAAPACLLLAGIPAAGVYPRVREIIVRPHAFGKVTEAIGPTGRRYRIPELHAGEAWLRGPIVLAWDNVRRSIAHPCDGYNVVYHEFAHALDMQTGLSGGGLALRTREAQGEWRRVFNEAYRAFVAANARGDTTFLNPYGAQSQAEFFAVITEHFFEQPRKMRELHALLYEQMTKLFGQDPARWGIPHS